LVESWLKSAGARPGKGGGHRVRDGNVHPCVKPVDLMQWLCRLVTPPGGLILDPFCGSGSTGIAALAEGFRFIGMELDAEYVEMARRRIAGPLFAQEETPT
jgi:site-specific DNA-methyltransferase (adenine-specific)